jgi:tRNA(fMet)-specific endonuclease VapC
MDQSMVLLDTDVLSAIMRKNPKAIIHARSYLEIHKQFTYSIITRYEILRGLQAKGAEKQLISFDNLCANSRILPLSDNVIVKAATIYADLHKRGRLINDADILIAATAIYHDLIMVSNNKAHFSRIMDLKVENWFE